MSYAPAWADVVADDAYLIASAASLTSSILPSAGWTLKGAGGATWTTGFWLVNPGTDDAAVTLKWLGHDHDGRTGPEFTYLVRAGRTLTDVVANFQANFYGDYGAILMTSSSPWVFLQSATYTGTGGGGFVGQALPALGAADYATVTPKTVAPIRENAAFRTNLVLANPTEIPVTAHVALFAADGTPIGSQDVNLPPLGMTQINRVASALGAATLDAGRISVSTATPGGAVAAYASVIDNVTNDPRTLLPEDGIPIGVLPPREIVTLLPSAASLCGLSCWQTSMTLVNTGPTDAIVTLKWLGHDADGRGGSEASYTVWAGHSLSLANDAWWLDRHGDYGAVLVTSSSLSLFLQSETSTATPRGGTVGQALAAFGSTSYADATPKSIAPILEGVSFRTNLVLANPTEIPVTAHVALFAADGTPIGSRDVDLPPLGMTQISRVATALGAPNLDAGRLAISTPTPGGAVAAYASFIDNVTNDPLTLLPR